MGKDYIPWSAYEGDKRFTDLDKEDQDQIRDNWLKKNPDKGQELGEAFQPEPEPEKKGSEYGLGDFVIDTPKLLGKGSSAVATAKGQISTLAGRLLEKHSDAIGQGLQMASVDPMSPTGRPSYSAMQDAAKNFKPGDAAIESEIVKNTGTGLQATGKFLKEAGDYSKGVYQESRSDVAKEMAKNKVFEGTFGGLFTGESSFGDTPLWSAATGAVESVPAMVASIPESMMGLKSLQAMKFVPKVAGGLQRLGLSGKSSEAVATWIQGGVAMGVSEGQQAGAEGSKQVGDEIRKMDLAALVKTAPRWQEYYDNTDPNLSAKERSVQAQEAIARDAESFTFITTSLMSAGIGTVAGGGLMGDFLGQPRKMAAKLLSMPKEGWQEFWQSGYGEKLPENIAKKMYSDGNQDLWQGTFEEGVSGAASGTLLGATGVASAGDTRTQGQTAKDDILSMTDLEVRQAHEAEYDQMIRALKENNPDLTFRQLQDATKQFIAANQQERIDATEGGEGLEANTRVGELRKKNYLTSDLIKLKDTPGAVEALGVEIADIDRLIEERQQDVAEARGITGPVVTAGDDITASINRTFATGAKLEGAQRTLEQEQGRQVQQRTNDSNVTNATIKAAMEQEEAPSLPEQQQQQDFDPSVPTQQPDPEFGVKQPEKEPESFEEYEQQQIDTEIHRNLANNQQAIESGDYKYTQEDLEYLTRQKEKLDEQKKTQALADEVMGFQKIREENEATQKQAEEDYNNQETNSLITDESRAQEQREELFDNTDEQVSDADARQFENTVNQYRADQAYENRSAGTERLLQEENVRQANEEAAIEGFSPEVKKQVTARAVEEAVEADPRKQIMRDVVKRGGLEIDSLQDYDQGTVTQLRKLHPGWLVRAGAVNADELANELGMSEDEFVQHMLGTPTIKQTRLKLLEETQRQWDEGTALQAEDEAVRGDVNNQITNIKENATLEDIERLTSELETIDDEHQLAPYRKEIQKALYEREIQLEQGVKDETTTQDNTAGEEVWGAENQGETAEVGEGEAGYKTKAMSLFSLVAKESSDIIKEKGGENVKSSNNVQRERDSATRTSENRPGTITVQEPEQTTLFTRAGTATQKKRKYLESHNVKISSFKFDDLEQVESMDDAAHVLSLIASRSQETLLALVLDKNKKPIAVLQHSIGGITSNSVYAGTLVGALHNTRGADSFWIAHNHPSGEIKPSPQDIKLTKALKNATEGIGVSLTGHLVMGSTGMASAITPDGESGRVTNVKKPTKKNKQVKVTERRLKGDEIESIGDVIGSSVDMKNVLAEHSHGMNGVLLMTAQNKPVKFVSITLSEMKALREGGKKGKAAQLYRLIDKKNIPMSAIQVKGEGANEAAQNMFNFLAQANATVLDTFIDGESSSDLGTDVDMKRNAQNTGSLFFSYADKTKAEQQQVDDFLDSRDDSERIKDDFNRLQGTNWENITTEAILVRNTIEDLLAGRTPVKNSSKLRLTGQTETTYNILKNEGWKGVWKIIQARGAIGNAQKPKNAVNSSYYNCSPSASCANFCYAAKGHYKYANPLVKGELIQMAVEKDPIKAARITAMQYSLMPEHELGKALRMFDKGDMSPQWVEYINELNRHGIRTQVFSKRPDLLRQISDKNLRMLSVDVSNMRMASENLDLDLAIVYDGSQAMRKFVVKYKDRLGVVLPVREGRAILPKEKLQGFPKAVNDKMCPIDSGTKKLKNGWTCTNCDKDGGIGCYFGNVSASIKLAERKPVDEGKDKKALLARLANMREIGKELSGHARREFYEQLDKIVSQVRRGVDTGATKEEYEKRNTGDTGRPGYGERDGRVRQTEQNSKPKVRLGKKLKPRESGEARYSLKDGRKNVGSIGGTVVSPTKDNTRAKDLGISKGDFLEVWAADLNNGHRGKGVIQQAIVDLANDPAYPSGVVVPKFQASKKFQAALRKIDGVIETDESIHVPASSKVKFSQKKITKDMVIGSDAATAIKDELGEFVSDDVSGELDFLASGELKDDFYYIHEALEQNGIYQTVDEYIDEFFDDFDSETPANEQYEPYENQGEPKPEEYEARARTNYGITYSPKAAGYILSDGDLLDFSQGQGERVQDHRAVEGEVRNPSKPGANRYGAIEEFGAVTGAIRMHYQDNGYVTFDILKKPTQDQVDAMINMISPESEVVIDYVDANGQTQSLEGEGAFKAKQLINEAARKAHTTKVDYSSNQSTLKKSNQANIRKEAEQVVGKQGLQQLEKKGLLEIVSWDKAKAMIEALTGTKFSKKQIRNLQKHIRKFKEDVTIENKTPEQQEIYEVITGNRKFAKIKKHDLEALDNYLMLERGGLKGGGPHGTKGVKILVKHFGGVDGKVTANEILDIGEVIRSTDPTMQGGDHVYHYKSDDGVKFTVVVKREAGKETIITFYSNRPADAEVSNAHNGIIGHGIVPLQTPDTATDHTDIISEDSLDVKKSEDGSTIEGFTVNGKSYLIEGNIATGETKSVLLHELSVHAKKLGISSDKKFNKILNNLYSRRNDNTNTGKAVREAVDRIPSDTPKAHQREEMLAYLITQGRTNIGLVRQAIARIKQFLVEKLGITPQLLNNTDMSALALNILQREAKVPGNPKTEPGSIGNAVPAMSGTAPTWYSPTAKAVAGLKQAKGNGKQMLAMIKKQPGVKQEEIDWIGLEDWLSGIKSVTQKEIADFIEQGGFQLEEVVKGVSDSAIEDWEFGADAYVKRDPESGDSWVYGYAGSQVQDWFDTEQEAQEALRKEAIKGIAENDRNSATIHQDYKLPGGKNYKELLLRLPGKSRATEYKNKFDSFSREMEDKYKVNNSYNAYMNHMTNAEKEKYDDLDRMAVDESNQDFDKNYQSDHYDEQNILAHIRFNERTDANGNRVLFLEEIQSDWHQEGRKGGYKQKTDTDLTDLFVEHKAGSGNYPYHVMAKGNPNSVSGGFKSSMDAENEILRLKLEPITFDSGSVPNAPFKKTPAWSGLAVKRMIRYAAENGFDSIAWTTGEQQADRYDLSKQVKNIGYRKQPDGKYDLAIIAGPNNQRLVSERGVTAEKAESIVGKEIVKKMDKEEGYDDGTWMILEGEDLKVGGEGMKSFYNKMLPNTVNKLIKKSGSKVEVTEIDGNEQLSFPVTDKMKSQALGQGMPMFSKSEPSKVPPITDPDVLRILGEMNEAFAKRGIKLKTSKTYEPKTGEAILEKSLTKIGNVSKAKVKQRYRKYEETVAKLKNSEVSNRDKIKAITEYIQTFPRNVKGHAHIAGIVNRITQAKTEAAKNKAIAHAIKRLDEVNETHYQNYNKKQIEKLIKKSEPKFKDGIHKQTSGGVSLRIELDKIKGVMKMSDPEIEKRLAAIADKAEIQELSDEDIGELARLNTFGNLRKMSADESKIAYDELFDMISLKRIAWAEQMEKLKEQRQTQKNTITKVVTGGKGIKDEQQRLRDELKENVIMKSIRSFDDMNQSFEWLLDKLSRFDKAGTLDSALVNMFTPLAHRASRAEERGTIDAFASVLDNQQKIFGKKGNALQKQIERNSEPIKNSGVFIYDQFTGKKGEELLISQNQAYKRWMEMQDHTLADQFSAQGYTVETLRDLESFMTPEIKAWAEWQVGAFYQDYWHGVNDVFQKLFYTVMPRNPNYSPIKRDYGQEGKEDENLLKLGSSFSSIINGNTKARVANDRHIMLQDGDGVLMNHIQTMEHFKAWSLPLREMRALLGSEQTQNAIRDYHGGKAVQVLNNFLDNFARGKTDPKNKLALLDKIRTNFTTGNVGLNPVVFMKQLTSIPAYAMEMPAGEWAMNLPKTPVEFKEMIDTMKSSTMMQARYGLGFERDMVEAMQTRKAKKMAGLKNWPDRLMFLTKWGDGIAISFGGWPVYKHFYKKAIALGRSEEAAREFAMEKFEMATERSQQAAGMKDMNYFQTGGSMNKLFTMFMTSPNAYYRQFAGGMRILTSKNKSRSDKQNALKRVFISHVVLPSLFQFIASGLDWDEDEQLRAMALGPLNGLFMVRDLASFSYDTVMGNRVFDDPLTAGISGGAADLGKMAKYMLKLQDKSLEEWVEDEDFIKTLEYGGKALGSGSGIPVGPGMRWAKGAKAGIVTGDTVAPAKRTLGFSEYAVDDTKKEYDTARKAARKAGKRKRIYKVMLKSQRKILNLKKRLEKAKTRAARREIMKKIEKTQSLFIVAYKKAA